MTAPLSINRCVYTLYVYIYIYVYMYTYTYHMTAIYAYTHTRNPGSKGEDARAIAWFSGNKGHSLTGHEAHCPSQ